jgi:hypothetical protein
MIEKALPKVKTISREKVHAALSALQLKHELPPAVIEQLIKLSDKEFDLHDFQSSIVDIVRQAITVDKQVYIDYATLGTHIEALIDETETDDKQFIIKAVMAFFI